MSFKSSLLAFAIATLAGCAVQPADSATDATPEQTASSEQAILRSPSIEIGELQPIGTIGVDGTEPPLQKAVIWTCNKPDLVIPETGWCVDGNNFSDYLSPDPWCSDKESACKGSGGKYIQD